MPAWAWLVPVAASATLGAAIALGVGTGARHRERRDAGGGGRRRGAPRRGRGAPRRRALRHARARRLGHRHRGFPHPLDDAHGRRRQGGAAARHHLLRDHDHLPTASSACACCVGGLHHREQSFRVGRRRAGPRRAHRPGDALARAAHLHDQPRRAPPTASRSSPSRPSPRSCCGRVFVFVQTVRHRDYFLPAADAANHDDPRRASVQAGWPGRASAC